LERAIVDAVPSASATSRKPSQLVWRHESRAPNVIDFELARSKRR
jgi:hypothetical protein